MFWGILDNPNTQKTEHVKRSRPRTLGSKKTLGPPPRPGAPWPVGSLQSTSSLRRIYVSASPLSPEVPNLFLWKWEIRSFMTRLPDTW